MTKSLNATFISEKNKQENQPIVLVTLYDYDGDSNNLNLAQWDSDVTFDSVTFTKFPLRFETINENAQGQIDAVRLVVGNVSRLIQSYLEEYDLAEKKVRIRIVWANQLASASTYLDYIYYIDSYQADAKNVEFVLTSRMDVADRYLPGGIYLRQHCRWKKFKDANTCGYSGGETECNRTKQRCKELGNYDRFGGFPSIPTRRIYVV